ncbi:ABC transporter ATP-binding protein [Paracoccus sp. CPCC 101403]|uniref:ABC transporter ATP-binding protein n=1 Tax=Paracoccus broussonetiae TaxID=3075834 RepID=A0ABU3ED10_9RHOB|nr:ABC transporter ATP-binding protein [Paracoccus sp. CPCC 101403]MDT1062128.1 ABC transporter ATP-binding protein [Paracoccus sp. CPCC 101403]
MQPLLRLRGVSKTYGQVAANAAIDLDVMPNSIHAILGENGAGKSTLMKLIYGVETADEGSMEWNGQPVRPGSAAEARALGIGMVFQHFSLFETLTVVENIALVVPGRKAAIAARVRELGARYGLEVNPAALVHSLSVGERQRVEILRCLMLEPRLLILDEPTSVLAPQNVELLFQTLRRLRDSGVSILFISHKLEEIRALCDRATILRGGRVTGEVDPRDHSAHALATLMIGRAMPQPLPAEPIAPGNALLEITGLTCVPEDPFGVTLSVPSLQVRAGEIVGIAGVSGNGQRELAALISGEDRLPLGDAIRIKARPVGRMGTSARRKLGFAFVPEDRLGRGAVPDMSLADNTLLTAHRRGLVRHGLIDRRREAAFTKSCMTDFDVRASGPEAEAGSLSGGNLQKFIMGREIMLEPDLLFVAQPTWGVDIGAAAQIRRRLAAMRNAGKAILVISEELEELFEICDRLHVLHHGHLSPSLPLPETSAEEIGEWMIGARGANHAA